MEPSDPASLLHGLLNHPWGQKNSRGEDLQPGDARLWQAFLDRPVAITGTTLDGTWTPLAGYLAREIRAARYPLKGLFGFHFLPHAWVYQANDAGHGALQGARNVAWRPGVSQNGLIALALLAKVYTRDLGDSFDTPLRRVADNREDFTGLEAEADLLGLVRLDAFCRAWRADAVRFTEIVLEKPNAKAAAALALVWGAALTRLPTWLEDAPDLGVRLLRALHGHGETLKLSTVSQNPPYRSLHTSTEGVRDLGLVMYALGRPLGLVGPANEAYRTRTPVGVVDLAALTVPQRRLAAELAIALQSPAWIAAFADAGRQGWLDADTVARFEAWHAHHAQRPAFNSPMSGHWAKVQALVLEARLPRRDVGPARRARL